MVETKKEEKLEKKSVTESENKNKITKIGVGGILVSFFVFVACLDGNFLITVKEVKSEQKKNRTENTEKKNNTEKSLS